MIAWLIPVLVVIAMAFMSQQKRICFIFFTIANFVWYFDLFFMQAPPIQWPYVGLVTTYFLFNVYSWITWGKKSKAKSASTIRKKITKDPSY